MNLIFYLKIEDVNQNAEDKIRKTNSNQITYNNLNLEEDFYYENLIEYENQIQIIEYNIELISKEYDELIKNEKLKKMKIILIILQITFPLILTENIWLIIINIQEQFLM